MVCGYLEVLEDRSDPSSPTIRLAVARFFHPDGEPEADPIIYLEGGPGGSALELLHLSFDRIEPAFGANRDIIADCRMAIDQARLLTLKAAWALDTKGTFGALTDISAIKVVAPNVLQTVVDAAIQIHGGEGMADPELSFLMGMARALRIADGPDEVHRGMVARLELKKYL